GAAVTTDGRSPTLANAIAAAAATTKSRLAAADPVERIRGPLGPKPSISVHPSQRSHPFEDDPIVGAADGTVHCKPATTGWDAEYRKLRPTAWTGGDRSFR